MNESHSVVSDSLRPHGLCKPWNSPGQNTGMGICFSIPFFRGSSQPRDQTQVFHIAGGFFIIWAAREAHTYHGYYKSIGFCSEAFFMNVSIEIRGYNWSWYIFTSGVSMSMPFSQFLPRSPSPTIHVSILWWCILLLGFRMDDSDAEKKIQNSCAAGMAL